MSRAAVVTGSGVVAPTGIGVDAFWSAAVDGRSALRPSVRFDSDPYGVALVGEVADFEAADWVEPRIAVQTDRFTHFALAAASMALRDAGLDPATVPPFGIGVMTASYSGGVEFGQREIERLWRDGPTHVGPYQSIAWFYAAGSGQISIGHGLRGPSGVLVADEAGGLDVVAAAVDELRRGALAMLVGGAEAPFSPFALCCQRGHGLLSASAEPTAAYLPHTDAAAGFVPAEGGAMLVVEREDVARRHGRRGLAVVAGHGATFTGTDLVRSAEGLCRAARAALAEAGARPEDVDVVFLDALADRRGDDAEARALRELLGVRAGRVPVTAPKTGYGRCYAGAAPLDVVAAVLAIDRGVVPPTPNVDRHRPELDLVTRRAREVDVRTALVLARGLTGGNSALVLRRPEPARQE
ncbi:ketosynthase chain-length factor [Saccharothrix sp. S26]|uniref:beta-ketoacyl synthase N-terminal-like domain-containing protein n=1 Tax=Saccharothrix sp. S26 TaxID=2907215 RepID=UPI001F3C8E23|nr:beta-ketoacyl synthase N-terminal-like domain-containing protein [Saccharothrix sp. S26]MCE6997194.1 ketosynthase chain-length factor [Saccharothrix sp. S26]